MEELAAAAYGAYRKSLAVTGVNVPQWGEALEDTREAWRSAVRAVGGNGDFERVLVQLAGCGVAAAGWGTSEEQAAKESDWGWSPAYGDVLKLRRAFDKISGGRSPDQVLGS